MQIFFQTHLVKHFWPPTTHQNLNGPKRLNKRSSISSRPILIPPDYSKPFIVVVDAYDFAIGASLIQEVDELERPVCFISRKLTPQQRNYSVIEKQAFALLTAVRSFSVYFVSEPVKVFTDHSPLQFLNRMSPHNQKLLRWNLE